MSDFDAYKPSWKNFSNYGQYVRYFFEYLKYGDFKSLGASLKYIFTHALPQRDYITSSGMGKFIIRKNTMDFQFINSAFERSVKDYMQQNLGTFDVFVDVGACIGEYCIWLAKEGKLCVAVEPVSWETLKTNIELNSVEDKVKLFACGAGEKKERVHFNIPESIKSSSHLSRNSTEEPNVDIDTVDNIMQVMNIPANSRVIMKFDVEGMEPEAIAGAKEFIKSCTNLRVIFEHFKENDLQNNNALLAICDFSFQDLDPVNRMGTKK
jgi:FkbM family methyltransferase